MIYGSERAPAARRRGCTAPLREYPAQNGPVFDDA